ncbi:MAG TPA: type IV secretory system conjugative DNA transfer family protein, partial [Acidimicrobiia bacterium]|nr:type IV secretory system conjugative DNA transfer family protein [Acidimicrobiia bacterium]
WFSAAEKMMSPYLFAAAVGGKDMATILRWIDTQEEREVMSILQRAGVPEAMTAFEANMKRDERTKSSIFTTAETIIDAYNDPLVCESAADPSIFASELLNGGKNTLYICAPSHEQERLQSIFTAIVSQMKSAAYELAGKQNRPIDPPLLICIDEAANIAPLSDLDAIASTAAGIGIQLVTIFQDMAQIEARYKEKSRTVVNNHRAKVILSGISDTGTLEYVSKLCGEEDIDQQSTSTSAQGERSTTDSKQSRTLASGAYLRRMKFGEGIVVYGQLSPAKLVLRQWFKDRVLKHMVEHGTKPGVVGGPTGSNSFGGGPKIEKDKDSIPDMSSVSQDTRYKAGDVGNQGPARPPLAGEAPVKQGAQATGEMSAFDKALAELRARDAGQPGDKIPSSTPGVSSLPSASVPPLPEVSTGQQAAFATSSTAPAPSASPSKWKPSGGGLVEETPVPSSPSSSVPGSTPVSTPTPIPAESSTQSSSKWSKGARPEFVEATDPLPFAQPTTAQSEAASSLIVQPEVQPISDVFAQYSAPGKLDPSKADEVQEGNTDEESPSSSVTSASKSKWK